MTSHELKKLLASDTITLYADYLCITVKYHTNEDTVIKVENLNLLLKKAE
jgi:hypothetical protein